jgi:peptidoglycan hydrolase CwlO-like protein
MTTGWKIVFIGRMSGWKIFLFIACGVALAIVSFTAYKTHGRLQKESRAQSERDQKTSHIQSQQESIQERVNALKKEMDEAKPPFDPSQVKSRQERLKALQEDLDAVKREVEGAK